MKTSDIVGLIRLIMYDILGLICPGAVLLFMLVRYYDMLVPAGKLSNYLRLDSTVHISIVVFIAYIMGYFLQSITYVHVRLFDSFGKRLLGKPIGLPNLGDPGVSAAGKFTSSYFAESDFYKHAKDQLAKFVGFDPEKLKYADASSLAFSLAGKEADTARDFRFRADLCGALATLALVNSLVFVPVVAISAPGSSWKWYLTPAIILMALFAILWVCNVKKPTDALASRREKYWGLGVLVIGVLLTGCLRLVFGRSAPAYWLFGPMFLVVWAFLLFRQFFYSDIGGRIIFHIALARISHPHESKHSSP